MTRSAACLAALLFSAAPASADDTLPLSAAARVGEARHLWTVSAHRADCTTDPERRVEMAAPPALGRITEREGVPSRVAHSLSGTCIGAHVTGLGVDDTAERPGTDRFSSDGVFRNGRVHDLVAAHNR